MKKSRYKEEQIIAVLKEVDPVSIDRDVLHEGAEVGPGRCSP